MAARVAGARHQRQSGIIGVGLSQDQDFIAPLLAILSEKSNAPLIPDVITALSRLRAKALNEVISPYLSHAKKEIRSAALNALAAAICHAPPRSPIRMDAATTVAIPPTT